MTHQSFEDEVTARLNRLSRRLARLEEQVPDVRAHDRDLARIGPQVAALEQRVEQLRLQASNPSESAANGHGSDMLDEVRRLHAQVRERVTALVIYEERIRVLEERMLAAE